MAEYQIPLSYVVNVSNVLPGKGLEQLKMSTILLLTDEQRVSESTDEYTIYRTASAVSSDWGTESVTAKMSNAIFSQQPNLLANGGYVIVAPYQGVQATAGSLTTGPLDYTNFTSVSDGVLNLYVDGVQSEVTSLDFTGVSSLQDVADIISAAYEGVTITVVDDTIVFVSDTTGAASGVTIDEKQGGTEGTDLYGSSYLDGENCIVVAGQNATIETYSAAITRLSVSLYFNGILTTRTLSQSEAVQASSTVQAMSPSRMLFIESNSMTSLTAGTGLFAQIQGNYFTKGLLYTYGSNSALNAKLFAAAYASRLFAVDYSGSNTCITMNLKDLVGIQADTNISETILNQCAALGVDVFASVEGLAKVLSNRQGVYFVDQVQNSIWYVNAIQRNVFNVLAKTRTKIPQTESGMQLLTNAINEVNNQAVTNGYLAPGKWNGADTFGVLDDFMRNIEESGYYVYHQPISQQSQEDREARKAPLFQIAGKEAGAVHSANILVYLEA